MTTGSLDSTPGFIMALSNTYGLVLILLLVGYGLVEVPGRFLTLTLSLTLSLTLTLTLTLFRFTLNEPWP